MPDKQQDVSQRVKKMQKLLDEVKKCVHRRWMLQDKLDFFLRKLDYADRQHVSELAGIEIKDDTTGAKIFDAASRGE